MFMKNRHTRKSIDKYEGTNNISLFILFTDEKTLFTLKALNKFHKTCQGRRLHPGNGKSLLLISAPITKSEAAGNNKYTYNLGVRKSNIT